ncbi:MAG: DUF1667 domain-containing protein [Spirochaetales bacterium]
MSEKIVICTVCPRGCQIKVTGEDGKISSISGFSCKRGEKFASDEFIQPKRIFTSTVKVKGGPEPLLPVRSDLAIPREKLFECMQEVRRISVDAPVKIGDIIIPNVLSLGCNIIACKTVMPAGSK